MSIAKHVRLCLLTGISLNNTKPAAPSFGCECGMLVLMLLCPQAHVFMKHLCRSVSVMWCMTSHPCASQPLAGWRLIINANYNHRSRLELERIIAPLWLCVCGWMCVLYNREEEGERGRGRATKCQVLMSQTDWGGASIDLFVGQNSTFPVGGPSDVTVNHNTGREGSKKQAAGVSVQKTKQTWIQSKEKRQFFISVWSIMIHISVISIELVFSSWVDIRSVIHNTKMGITQQTVKQYRYNLSVRIIYVQS